MSGQRGESKAALRERDRASHEGQVPHARRRSSPRSQSDWRRPPETSWEEQPLVPLVVKMRLIRTLLSVSLGAALLAAAPALWTRSYWVAVLSLAAQPMHGRGARVGAEELHVRRSLRTMGSWTLYI